MLSDKDRLRNTFADAHRRYTGYINACMRATGHLWQGRFGSVVMDETHLFNAVRYVSLNPVRAKLVRQAQGWKWSSVSAHLSGKDDKRVKVSPTLQCYGDFAALPGDATDDDAGFKHLRQSETTGRPLGGEEWMDRLEILIGKTLKPQKRGPKKKYDDNWLAAQSTLFDEGASALGVRWQSSAAPVNRASQAPRSTGE